MSTTEEQIRAAQEKHAAEMSALQKKAKQEQEALQTKRKAELEDIAKHGRKRAIEALVALDVDGIYVIEDGPIPGWKKEGTQDTLYVLCGDEKTEVKVEERFESTGLWSSRQGASKGFWYTVDSWHSDLFDRSRSWKKPETAHAKLVEAVAIKKQRDEHKSVRDRELDAAVAQVKSMHPNCDVERYRSRYGERVRATHPSGGGVSFSVHDGEVSIESVDTDRVPDDTLSALADMILTRPVKEKEEA